MIKNFANMLFAMRQKFDSPAMRLAEFKSFRSKREFQLSSVGPENYVVISSDNAISKHAFVDGHFGWAVFEKVVYLLKSRFAFDLIIDIGGNIGTTCIPAVKRGYFKQAIVFEPEPRNFRVLMANIYLNGLEEKITAYNLALGAETGTLAFELSEDNSGDHRVSVTNNNGIYNEQSRNKIHVTSDRLDNIVADNKISKDSTLLWIDTQGYEGYVLTGAEKILEKNIPLIVEFWPYGLNRAGCYPAFKKACLLYKNFYDLSEADPVVRDVTENAIDVLYQKFIGGDGHTDLLLL